MEALSIARHREQTNSLWAGRKLCCPRCGTSSDPESYFTFDRQPGHEDCLNIVYKCRAKVENPNTGKLESCRNIFSPAGQDAVGCSV